MTAIVSPNPIAPFAAPAKPLRLLFALPGLHRVVRGAEVAFEELAKQLALTVGCDVTLIGSGRPRPNDPYRFLHAGSLRRELFTKFPKCPGLRSHYMYEEFSFTPALLRTYKPADFDITVTCAYPYTNWILRARKSHGHRPPHIFVTQNGDWMIQAKNWEYKHFACDGLVCTNPDFYERHHKRWPSTLIPNGVDPAIFSPGESQKAAYGLPQNAPVILMVSAFIPSKRVLEGIRSVARIRDALLVVAGAGELEAQAAALANQLMPGRFFNLKLPREKMPGLYRAADVFLHMSMIESSANAYIEALATGLPIVTHDRLVTRWTLEETSILVDTQSENEVVQGIQRALLSRDQHHVQSRKHLAQTRFAWSAIAGQYVDFFRKIIASPAGSRCKESTQYA